MDIKKQICGSLTQAKDMYLKDIGYIPADKLDVSPMAQAKTAKAMTVECAGLFRGLTSVVSGTDFKRPTPEDRAAYLAKFKTTDEAKAEFAAAADALLAAIGAMDVSELDREVTAPWGAKVPLGTMLFMAISHTSYHDGQLNYIQTLYGDNAFHWME
jgi:uncharacterized damage-inducible protein DinB